MTDFIEYVLNEVRLPLILVQLMMECVSTVRYQICFNGEFYSSKLYSARGSFVPLFVCSMY